MLTTQWTRGRFTATPHVSRPRARAVYQRRVAGAAPRTLGFEGAAPVIDGNGDDLINFAAGIDATSCAVVADDLRDDIAIADPKIVVCAPLSDTNNPPDGIDDYFVNGFDLRKFVLVYDRPNKNLYVLWRMEGIVGDIDGNLTPDNSDCLPPPRSPTSPASAARRTTRPASTRTATASPTSSSRSAASSVSTR